VAGSWGVGQIERTLDDLGQDDGVTIVCVCGHDERLRRRLGRRESVLALGWTDDMAELMAAADVLVENAGGLTSFEAMAIGLPVISYRPIAGHGRDNARAMHDAGVATFVENRRALLGSVRELADRGPRRDRQVGAAAAIFERDAAVDVAALVVRSQRRRRKQGPWRRVKGVAVSSELL
jgi:UDP-N-acetylglucosamine:LPS N-acetylglucosamine transferase